MNIGLITSSYKPNIGGVEEAVYRLASNLNKEGNESVIITNKWPDDLPYYSNIDNLNIYRLDFCMPNRSVLGVVRFLYQAPITMWKLKRIINDNNIDLLHVHCVSSNGFYALLVKILFNIPLIVTLHGETIADDHDIYNKSSMLKWTLKKIMQKADWITANSQYILNDTLKRFGGSQSKFSVLYNGIDLDEFVGVEPYKHSKLYIFATGRLVYKKGFDLLIKAFAKIADKYKDVDLLISGSGEYEEELTLIIRSLGLCNRVHLLGPVNREKNISLFKGCVFFVMPSRFESFGLVCLEAMAAGKPVIFTKNGGTKEFVKDSFGIQIDPENIDEFTKALDSLLSSDKTLKDMSVNAKEEVENFKWLDITNKYLEIYKKVTIN